MVFYTGATVLVSFVLIPAAGLVYAGVAILAGAWFAQRVWKLYRETCAGKEVVPLKVFLQSNEYLALLFCGLAIDAVFHLPTIGSYFA